MRSRAARSLSCFWPARDLVCLIVLFNSPEFLAFFVVFYALYLALPGPRGQNVLILVASYIFYGWAAPRYAILLAFYTVATYGIGIRIDVTEGGARRAWLILGILVNLGVLGYFKY